MNLANKNGCVLGSKNFDRSIISKKGFSQKEDISAGYTEPYKCVQNKFSIGGLKGVHPSSTVFEVIREILSLLIYLIFFAKRF